MKKHDASYKTKPRSGGPQTPEGKKKCSGNSRRHGILSDTIVVLHSESESGWEELLNGYLEELQPVGLLEVRLVQQMAWAEWRQIRAIRVESATLDRQMDVDDEQKWQHDDHAVDDDTRTCHAMRKLVDDSNQLQHLSRYETRFNRMYFRALKQLLELQEKRRSEGARLLPETRKPSETEPPPSESGRPETPADPATQPENINLPNEQPVAAVQPNYVPRNSLSKEPAKTPPPLLVLTAA
jgi:hypothetical protein